jgi:hypothetical protein
MRLASVGREPAEPEHVPGAVSHDGARGCRWGRRFGGRRPFYFWVSIHGGLTGSLCLGRLGFYFWTSFWGSSALGRHRGRLCGGGWAFYFRLLQEFCCNRDLSAGSLDLVLGAWRTPSLLWLLRRRGRRRRRGLRGLWRRFHGRCGGGRLVCHFYCNRFFAKTHQQILKTAKIQSIKRTKLMLGTMFNTL